MTALIRQLTIDARDVEAVARFWADALGYRIDRGDDGSAKLYPADDAPADVCTIWVQRVADAKSGKNRAHPDLRPADGDVEAEVERLLGLGATRTDVGQTGTEGFVVLADPDGNEFCVLRSEPRG